VYDVRRGSKGDMYVEVAIAMPKHLTDRQVGKGPAVGTNCSSLAEV
jgi:DnaJ-class molecular chaperone